jgi:putative holliday junction resolvase
VTRRARLLGIDYGSRRIGLAVSDADRRIASPLVTYQRTTKERDSGYFKQIVEQEEIGELIVGLPIHLDGREGQKALEARAFGKWLQEMLALPAIFWDERFTSVEAESHLLAAGLTNKRRQGRRDRVAAQIMLQSYLDAGCPGEQRLGPLGE